jgi:hypothetical protein
MLYPLDIFRCLNPSPHSIPDPNQANMLYPLDVFHCERQTSGSNFKMTTLGFELFRCPLWSWLELGLRLEEGHSGLGPRYP